MSTCYECHGEGWIVTCMDDMCRGAGECMHGDGNTLCPKCDGDGELDPEDFEEDA